MHVLLSAVLFLFVPFFVALKSAEAMLGQASTPPAQGMQAPRAPAQETGVAVGQNLYLFGDDYPPKIVYFKGFWDVHRGGFDPLPMWFAFK